MANTKFQSLKSIAKKINSSGLLNEKVKLNWSAEKIEASLYQVAQVSDGLADLVYSEMIKCGLLSSDSTSAVLEYANEKNFPLLSGLKPQRQRLDIQNSRRALDDRLISEFDKLGFLTQVGDAITGEYAVLVLSLLWDADWADWPIQYRTDGYKLPITIVVQPDHEIMYLSKKWSLQEWGDLEASMKDKLTKLGFSKDPMTGEIITPKLIEGPQRFSVENQTLLEIYSEMSPLFTVGGVEYFQEIRLRNLYTSTTPTLLNRNKGRIIKDGFNSTIRQPLLKPLVSKGELIRKNVIGIEFPEFNLTRLGSTSNRKRLPSYRKTAVKTKISWGTDTKPPMVSPEISLARKIRLPNRKTDDRLLITQSGDIYLYSEGKKVARLGRFNFKNPSESYWVKGLPLKWMVDPISGSHPLDDCMEKILVAYSEKTVVYDHNGKVVAKPSKALVKELEIKKIDSAFHELFHSNTKRLTDRQLKRLKQNARKYCFNNYDILPVSVRMAVDRLKDPTTTADKRVFLNRTLMGFYHSVHSPLT